MLMPFIILIGCALSTTSDLLVVGEVSLVSTGYKFTEGPLYLPEGVLIFSDIPADTIYREDKTIFRNPSGQSNGLTLDREGRLIACEHKNRRVTRTEKDGSITVLAERYEGKRLNSPNDVIVRSDGVIFFTDPPYGLPGGLEGPEAELTFAGVYLIVEGMPVKLLVNDFVKPNGLALSPDEKTLYIADTEARHIRAFDVDGNGGLSQERVFCSLPGPDGLKVDTKGNVWCTASDGVRVYDPEGSLKSTVRFPEIPANCTFGGNDSRTLFVTARKSVYKVQTIWPGIHPKPNHPTR